jgi:hypothetical protein
VAGPGAEIAGTYVAGAAIVDGAPVTSGIGMTAGLSGNGLSPPLPVSTEPIGIPEGEPPPVVAVDIAADDAVPLVELVSHGAVVVVPLGNGVPIVIPPPS